MIRPIVFVLMAAWSVAGCASPLYSWGQYEDSLHTRMTDASAEGKQRAFGMLEKTIREAEQAGQRVPPGVYADYGYLLYRGNQPEEAVRYFRREAELYPESKPLMDSVISRINQKKASP